MSQIHTGAAMPSSIPAKPGNGEVLARASRRRGSSLRSVQAMSPQLMTVPEVAELLRTSDKAIYSMVTRGQLPGVVRIGRRVLFDQEVLVRWIDESRAPSPKERRA